MECLVHFVSGAPDPGFFLNRQNDLDSEEEAQCVDFETLTDDEEQSSHKKADCPFIDYEAEESDSGDMQVNRLHIKSAQHFEMSSLKKSQAQYFKHCLSTIYSILLQKCTVYKFKFHATIIIFYSKDLYYSDHYKIKLILFLSIVSAVPAHLQ